VQQGVDLAARHHLYPMTCLPRSLVLHLMLARMGIKSELRIGVRKADGRLQAHAWVERGTRPVGESVLVTSRFAPFCTPRASR
jgi:hypothetical protein